jgi:3-mercaptopyruvate sulfurtransferase SseA
MSPVRLAAQAAALATAGSLAGLAANGFSPRPIRLTQPMPSAAEQAGACKLPGAAALVPRISVAEAAPLCAACAAAFVDARGAGEFAAGHASGALHLPPGEIPLELLLGLERFRTVVVYDDDPASGRADQVATALVARGIAGVRVLAGAWPAWIAAGAPGESGACSTCSGRQGLP